MKKLWRIRNFFRPLHYMYYVMYGTSPFFSAFSPNNFESRGQAITDAFQLQIVQMQSVEAMADVSSLLKVAGQFSKFKSQNSAHENLV